MRKDKLPALLLAGLLLGGCAAPKAGLTPTPAPTPTEVNTPTPTPTPTPKAEPQEAPKSYKNIGEETYAYQYEGYNYQIKYPYLCGSAEDKELNDLLRQEALGHYLTGDENDIRSDTPDGFMGYIDGNWAATRNDDKLLSVYFEQEYCSGGPVGWNHWGVTIDRANKKRLSLADLVDTGDDFEAWLYAQDWTALKHWQGGGDEIGKDRAYIEYQLPLYLARSADPAEHIRDFYLTDTDLIIIVWEFKYDTPLSVPLADLTLKGENLWNA